MWGGGVKKPWMKQNTPGGESHCLLIWLGQIKEPGAPRGQAATQAVQSVAGKLHDGLNTKECAFQPEQQQPLQGMWLLRLSYRMLTDTDERANLRAKPWSSASKTRSSH